MLHRNVSGGDGDDHGGGDGDDDGGDDGDDDDDGDDVISVYRHLSLFNPSRYIFLLDVCL